MGEGGGEIWAENGCGMPGDKKTVQFMLHGLLSYGDYKY